MNRSCVYSKKAILIMAAFIFLMFFIAPAQAYYFGDWNTDGYFKSQFGIFTEKKPFNKARFGGSDDNIATARQTFRWNVNGQISKQFALRAEVLAVWEPNYPGEKGVLLTDGPMPANYYNSFDWRELTLEYKPTYAHSIKFGRQIINWGEVLSGRVIDQCNPTDSRASAGFLALEEIYMPLWMFRGQHDFYSFYSTSLEWVAAPIWQADEHEHSRGAASDTPVGDARTTSHKDLTSVTGGWNDRAYRNDPGARYSAKRDDRVPYGADISINILGKPGSVLGAPYNMGYHGTDMLPGYTDGDPIHYLTYDQIISNDLIYLPGIAGTHEFINQHQDAKFIFLSESPISADNAYKYTDHNFKNTRWGFKTKSQIGEFEGGISFFQGPGATITKIIRYDESSAWTGYNIFQYQVVRQNTFGLYGNTTLWGTKWWFEGAYQPDVPYQKDLMGIGFGYDNPEVQAQRLDNIEYVDTLTTMWGVTREQNWEWLNPYNTFSINFQYTNTYRMEDTDGLVSTAYFWEVDRMSHSFLLMISTGYSYNKYNPSLTLAYDPSGCGLVSASLRYVPEGFNTRLSLNANISNYWTGPEFAGTLSLYDNNDSITIGFQYSFY